MLALIVLVGTLALQTLPASAAIALPHYLNSVPAATTPHALGTDKVNTVADIVQAGSRMFYGGYFLQASSPDKRQTFNCGNLIVQDLRTGAASCPVRFSGRIEALVASADGHYVYAGGAFSTVTAHGKSYHHLGLARIDTTTMSVTPFDIELRGGAISDLKLVGSSLIVAGSFKTIHGVERPALASVSATTGKLTNYMNYSITGTVASNAGATKVYRIAVNRQNNRAVIMGNFTRVGGNVHVRAALLRLDTTATRLTPWFAPALAQSCAKKLPAYIRDVDFSPDGNEFAMAATGGQWGYPTVCDAVSMWPTNESTKAAPKWIDYTPNDTMHSVVHTGAVVYTAGHEKAHNTRLYQNGKQVSPSIAPEVPVSGIAALYASSGRVVPRNVFWAGRDRGEGARKLLAVPADAYHSAGLYVGSDTEWWYDRAGERAYNHERITFLPMQ